MTASLLMGKVVLDWMVPYDARLYGYDKFLSQVGVLVIGRCNFQQ